MSQDPAAHVVYVLTFFLETRTKNNSGKKTWRLCEATRKFEASELPRITPRNETLLVAGINFTPVKYCDVLTDEGMGTLVQFHYQMSSWEIRRGIEYTGHIIPCIDGRVAFNDRSFLKELGELGFTILVRGPATGQPTAIPR